MVPAVALRHPQDFIGRIRVAVELLAGIVDERLALLVDDRVRLAGHGVHRDDPQHLMAALVEQEREPAGVRCPAPFLGAPGVRKQVVADGDFLIFRHIEQVRLGDRDPIAGLEVIVGLQFGLHLIRRRRLDQVDFPLVALLRPQSDQLLAVGRPEHLASIAVGGLPLLGEGEFLAAVLLAQIQVVVLDERRPFAVRGVRAARRPWPARRNVVLRRRGWRSLLRKFLLRQGVSRPLALPRLAADFQPKRLALGVEAQVVDRQPGGGEVLARNLRQRRRQLLGVERGLTLALHRVHQDELAVAAGQVAAIPEAVAVRRPVRCDRRLENLVLRQPAQLRRAFVVRRRAARRPLLRRLGPAGVSLVVADVAPFVLLENAVDQAEQFRVAFLQFLPRIDVVVIARLRRRGAVEIRLDALRPVLLVVGRRVGVLPGSLGHRVVVAGPEPAVEIGVDAVHPHFVDDVAEFVDEDVFLVVAVALEVEQVLLAAADGRPGGRRPEAAGAAVPVLLRLQVAVFGHVRRLLVGRHDGQAHLVLNDRLPNVVAAVQHVVDDGGRLQQRVIRRLVRTENGETIRVGVLLVERRQVERVAQLLGHGRHLAGVVRRRRVVGPRRRGQAGQEKTDDPQRRSHMPHGRVPPDARMERSLPRHSPIPSVPLPPSPPSTATT